MVERWANVKSFTKDIDLIISEGLVTKSGESYKECRLTELGEQVARMAEAKGLLWRQTHALSWDKQHRVSRFVADQKLESVNASGN
ncbi:hypothetical protein [Variovorax paradoxus]|uniref:hypothetical protein n=1 Tax=Variovorax paradoxus TaxID=34073 RepID=UPI0019313E60|nr:hypothetical protein INQ48_40840 [Variovorax paradoxus]